jgi:isopentenyl-diphosphate delta-isomerase
MSTIEYVILVDENNNELGLMEKQEAHQKALLHRAFSILVFNSKGELLLQQRAQNKYHSAGLWTNTCCSHPRFDESTLEAANRRLMEEMGFDCILKEYFHFIYHAPLDNGLTEHELDFVYIGTYDGMPQINESEVSAYRWVGIVQLMDEMHSFPEHFTCWFRIIMEKYIEHTKT